MVWREEAGRQRLPMFAHPRFRAKVNGKAAVWKMDDESGLVRMDLGSGETMVEMEWSRGWGQALSLAGLGMLFLAPPIWATAWKRLKAIPKDDGEN